MNLSRGGLAPIGAQKSPGNHSFIDQGGGMSPHNPFPPVKECIVGLEGFVVSNVA